MARNRSNNQVTTTLWYQLSDQNYSAFLQNFQKICEAYQGDLSLSDAKLELVTDANSDFDLALADVVTSKLAMEGAVDVKNSVRAGSSAVIRQLVAEFQANPNIPENVYALLDIPKRGTRGSRGAAITPTNVLAVGRNNGDIDVSFDRGGNPRSVTFELQHFRNGGWITVTAGNRTRFRVTGYAIGVEATFRVVAVRNGIAAAPSMTATAWGTGEEGTLTLAA